MKLTLAYGRNQLPFSTDNINVTENGHTTIPRTLYFAIQGENYLGLNLPSTLIGPVTIGVGQKVLIAPPTILPAEKWLNFVVSASSTNNAEDLVQLGKIPAFTVGGQRNTSPLILSTDAQFALSAFVATIADLPLGGAHGMMRGVLSSGVVYEYNAIAQVWSKSNRLFNVHIADINKAGGCAQDIRYLEEFTPPTYLDDGSKGTSVSIWMINDTAVPESSGKRLGMVVKLNEEIKTNYFDKKLWLVFRGYVNTATNTIRTKDSNQNNFDYVDQEIPFDANNATLVLQDALQPLEAFAIDIYPRFNLNLVSGTQVKVYPFFYEEAGEYSEAGEIIGDVIYNSGDRCLVVPGTSLSAKILSGKGMIGNFSFQAKSEKVVYGLKTNTPMQAIAIDGNGYSRIITSNTQEVSEAIRAYVSTVDGVGIPSNWSASFYIPSNNTIIATCTYPYENGIGKIRNDYPDTKIAGLAKAVFNPTTCVIYIKRLSDNQIRSFELNAVVPDSSQSFNISSWASGKLVTALPTPAPDFGLFSPPSCTLSPGVGASDIAVGNYQVACAFYYKNTITSISHDEVLGCITTISASFASVISRSAYWAEPVASIDSLKKLDLREVQTGQQRSILSPIDVFRFDLKALANDDGETVIRPESISASSPGRWIAVRDPKTPTVVLSSIDVAPIPPEDKVVLYLSNTENLFALYSSGEKNTFTFLEKTQVFHQAQAVEPIEISPDYRDYYVYLNMHSSNRFMILLQRTIDLLISDISPGYAFELKIQQGAEGGNNLNFPSQCKFTGGLKPSVSPEPGTVDILSCVCFEENVLYCFLAKGF